MVGIRETQGKPPKEIYNWRTYFASVCAGFGGALFGYDNAFLGGTLALTSFRNHFSLTGMSDAEAGCFGALPCAEIFRRRISLITASIIFTIGAAIQLTGSLEAFYAGRFLTGLGVGPMTSLAPLYISEIAPPMFRGRCVGIFECCYQLGGLLGFWINYGVSTNISNTLNTQWRIPVAMQLPLTCCFFCGELLLPESPRFLLKKDLLEKATLVLSRLRNLDPHHEYLRHELANIQSEIKIERDGIGLNGPRTCPETARALIKECLRHNVLHRISVGVITQTIAQLSGINGINYYSPKILQSLGVMGTSTSLFATGIYGVVKTITAMIALLLLVDRLDRKTLLLSGCCIMSFSLFFVGSYIKIAKPTEGAQHISSGGITACAFIYVYVISFTSSFAETVPMGIRAISATLGAATQWLMNLAITKATPYMISSIGYGTFYFFGPCVVVGAADVWFFVPETKGVELEHMAAVFGHEDVVANDLANDEMKDEKGAVKQVDYT